MAEKDHAAISAALTPSLHSAGDKADGSVIEGHDLGATAYAEARHYTSDTLEAEQARVKRKLDRILLPLLMVSFTFQFLDKLSLNYAAAYTLVPDLGLTGQKYSTVASAFSYGNIAWYLPASYLIQRLPVAKYTGSMITVWGILLMCSAGAKNFGGIFALRFILGMAEANMTPAYIVICSMFYTRQELPLRVLLFVAMNGLATALGALIAYGLGHASSTAIASWQLIFVVIGAINFVWSFLFLYLVPDTPMSARWLTPSERLIVVNRVSGNMMGIMDKSFKAHQVREALLDPRLWLLYLAGAANGIVSGGLGYFASALIKGYGFSGLNATLLQLPTGILELIALPVAGWIASRYKNMRCIVYVVFSLIPLGGLLGIRLTSLDHQWSLMGSTWLLYIFAVQSSMSYSLLASNVAGHTKRATANGLWFVIWSAGSVGGVNSFNADEAPRYFSGITVLCSCMVASMVLILILRHAMWWENRRRDKKYGVRDVVSGEADDEGIRSGFLDRTDVENKHFRYAL